MLALRSIGFLVLRPFGQNTRYDLVIDDHRKLRIRSAADYEIGIVETLPMKGPVATSGA